MALAVPPFLDPTRSFHLDSVLYDSMELDQTLVDYLVTALEEEDVLFTHYWVSELREKGQLPQALEQIRTFPLSIDSSQS